MAPITPLQDNTSDICTALLDAMRELRSESSRRAHFLSRSPANQSINARSTLLLITSSLRAHEQPLILLRNEVESGLPLEDLGVLSQSISDSIHGLQLHVLSLFHILLGQPSSHHTLDTDFFLSVADDLHTFRQTAIQLAAACAILDHDLCADAHRWTDDDSGSSSRSSSIHANVQRPLCLLRLATHAQPPITLGPAAHNHHCPVCQQQEEDRYHRRHRQPTEPDAHLPSRKKALGQVIFDKSSTKTSRRASSTGSTGRNVHCFPLVSQGAHGAMLDKRELDASN